MASSAPTGGAADDGPVKRARTSRPKVKTGCGNCKKRRIKCDELRPACYNCIKASQICPGYPPPRRYDRHEAIPIAPRPVLAAAGPSLAPTPPGWPATLPASQAPLPSLAPQPMTFIHAHHPSPHQQLQAVSRRAHKNYQRRNTNTPPVASPAPISPFITMIYTPSVVLPFNHLESQYFELFRWQTTNELSGYFDDIFWSCSVLAECHNSVAIRHAVVALGALYKTLEKKTESPPSSPGSQDPRERGASHWHFALHKYSAACKAVAAIDDDSHRAQRTRLMASVLLACFDSFVGDHKQAISQIQMGLGLLERLRERRRRMQAQAREHTQAGKSNVASSASNTEPVEDELLQMFTRLAIQAKSYDMAFHFPQPYVIRLLPPGGAAAAMSELASNTSSPSSPAASSSSDAGSPVSSHQEPIPPVFATLREARLAWDTLCELMLRFTETMFQHTNDGRANILPTSMKRYGAQFGQRIQAWSEAFAPLLARRMHPDVGPQEKTGIAVLKMFQIMGLILYLMTFSDSEMQFDQFRPMFQQIVDLAKEVVCDDERRAAAKRCPDPRFCTHRQHYRPYASHIKPSFSADLGIVPPLYVVATKSRDRLLRREAIMLLRSSARREGMWDAELTARISTWVMEIEEEGEEEQFHEMMKSLSISDYSDYSMERSSSDTGSLHFPLTPGTSPAPTAVLPHHPPPGHQSQNMSHPVPSLSGARENANASSGLTVDFGSTPLGPGGNARWNARRPNHAAMAGTAMTGSTGMAGMPANLAMAIDPSLPYYMQPFWGPVPAEKRVLITTCEFNLRGHTAMLQCGTRGFVADPHDQKKREKHLQW